MTKFKGFTLIEMLVSMALLAMVVLSASSAFSFFAQRWDGQLGKFDDAMRHARDLMLIQEVLDSLVPYVVYEKTEQPVIYFEGNRNGFVAVSEKSVFGGIGHSVVRFSVSQTFDFDFDVLYEEAPMAKDVLRTTMQPINFLSPLVLFEGVRSPSFEYYGWSSREQRNGVDGVSLPATPTWLSDYNALDIGFSPVKVRLVFEDKKGHPYEILASVSDETPGLVAKYQGTRRRQLNDHGEMVNNENGCDC